MLAIIMRCSVENLGRNMSIEVKFLLLSHLRTAKILVVWQCNASRSSRRSCGAMLQLKNFSSTRRVGLL